MSLEFLAGQSFYEAAALDELDVMERRRDSRVRARGADIEGRVRGGIYGAWWHGQGGSAAARFSDA